MNSELNPQKHGFIPRTFRGPKIPIPPRQTALEWLKEQIETRDRSECWEWPFGHANGYGTLAIQGSPRRAHRTAKILDGSLPPFEGAQARHTCDRRYCCNPDHVLWGTAKDNAKDLRERGVNYEWMTYVNGKLRSDQSVCIWCAKVFTMSPHGPKPKYCGAVCRQRTYEYRKRERAIAEAKAEGAKMALRILGE